MGKKTEQWRTLMVSQSPKLMPGTRALMIVRAGFGGLAAANIRALPPQSYELQFFYNQVD